MLQCGGGRGFFGGGGWIEVNLCRYDSIFVELMFDFAKIVFVSMLQFCLSI